MSDHTYSAKVDNAPAATGSYFATIWRDDLFQTTVFADTRDGVIEEARKWVAADRDREAAGVQVIEL